MNIIASLRETFMDNLDFRVELFASQCRHWTATPMVVISADNIIVYALMLMLHDISGGFRQVSIVSVETPFWQT